MSQRRGAYPPTLNIGTSPFNRPTIGAPLTRLAITGGAAAGAGQLVPSPGRRIIVRSPTGGYVQQTEPGRTAAVARPSRPRYAVPPEEEEVYEQEEVPLITAQPARLAIEEAPVQRQPWLETVRGSIASLFGRAAPSAVPPLPTVEGIRRLPLAYPVREEEEEEELPRTAGVRRAPARITAGGERKRPLSEIIEARESEVELTPRTRRRPQVEELLVPERTRRRPTTVLTEEEVEEVRRKDRCFLVANAETDLRNAQKNTASQYAAVNMRTTVSRINVLAEKAEGIILGQLVSTESLEEELATKQCPISLTSKYAFLVSHLGDGEFDSICSAYIGSPDGQIALVSFDTFDLSRQSVARVLSDARRQGRDLTSRETIEYMYKMFNATRYVQFMILNVIVRTRIAPSFNYSYDYCETGGPEDPEGEWLINVIQEPIAIKGMQNWWTSGKSVENLLLASFQVLAGVYSAAIYAGLVHNNLVLDSIVFSSIDRPALYQYIIYSATPTGAFEQSAFAITTDEYLPKIDAWQHPSVEESLGSEINIPIHEQTYQSDPNVILQNRDQYVIRPDFERMLVVAREGPGAILNHLYLPPYARDPLVFLSSIYTSAAGGLQAANSKTGGLVRYWACGAIATIYRWVAYQFYALASINGIDLANREALVGALPSFRKYGRFNTPYDQVLLIDEIFSKPFLTSLKFTGTEIFDIRSFGFVESFVIGENNKDANIFVAIGKFPQEAIQPDEDVQATVEAGIGTSCQVRLQSGQL